MGQNSGLVSIKKEERGKNAKVVYSQMDKSRQASHAKKIELLERVRKAEVARREFAIQPSSPTKKSSILAKLWRYLRGGR